MSAPRVLVVEHQDTCPPALLGGWLADAGCTLEVVRPYVGEGLPGSLTAEGYAALLVLGGSMDAFDATVSWLAATRALVLDAAEHDVPTLGVCLGHQLAALALGGSVARNPRGRQAGLRDLGRTPDGEADPLVGPLTGPAIFSNQDVVTALPPGAVELARAATGELQAARLAPTVWGVQWHPEATREVFGGWARADAERHRAGPQAAQLRGTGGSGGVAVPQPAQLSGTGEPGGAAAPQPAQLRGTGEGAALPDPDALIEDVETARPALDADGRRLATAFAALAGGVTGRGPR